MGTEQQRTFYRLISTIYTSPYGEQAVTYGMEAVIAGQVAVFSDIALSVAAVESFIRRLQSVDVAFCHLEDMVVDYVAELATL